MHVVRFGSDGSLKLVYRNRVRGAAVAVLVLSIAFLGGRLWFDEREQHRAASQRNAPALDRSTSATSGLDRRFRSAMTSTPVHEAHLPQVSPPGGDRALLEAWESHREAMTSLYDIIFNEFLYRHGPLAACRKLVDKRRCSARFQCAVHGQEVEVQLERVDCGVQRGNDPSEAALRACVERTLEIPGPLGLPVQTAAELAGYDGPIEVAWWAE